MAVLQKPPTRLFPRQHEKYLVYSKISFLLNEAIKNVVKLTIRINMYIIFIIFIIGFYLDLVARVEVESTLFRF